MEPQPRCDGPAEISTTELLSGRQIECPKAAIVYAGLLFSALTVLGWSRDMFGSTAKAVGFTALLEGIMMTADAGWLSAIALGYLVVINAVANGCRLALRDTTTATAVIDWASNLARGIAAAAAGTAMQARKPERRARQRRARSRKTEPRLAAVAAVN